MSGKNIAQRFSEFSLNAQDTKAKLDKFFRIPIREYAAILIEKMRDYNSSDELRMSIGDYHTELMKIMESFDEYVEDNNDGNGKAVALLKNFKNAADNEAAFLKYSQYIEKMASMKEYDRLFFDKLNFVYQQYPSSADYMSRMVKRLIEYNFPDENYDLSEPTRVLILKHFIRQFGYFEGISDFDYSAVKKLVAEKYGGDYMKIDDSVFDILSDDSVKSTVKYTGKYIFALAKLQGIIIFKARAIRMTRELCAEICELVEATVIDEKTNESIKVLTDAALDGSAEYLSDCFYDHTDFEVFYFKNYKDADIEKADMLAETLKEKCKKKAKTKDNFSPESFLYIIRAVVLVKDMGKRIPVTEEIGKAFRAAFPRAVLESDGNNLFDCISEKDRKDIADTRMYGQSPDIFSAYEDFAIKAEALLGIDKDKKLFDEYVDRLYKLTESRYNGAAKNNSAEPSKGGYLLKNFAKLLGADKADYTLLRMADSLANASFSAHHKTREYLYIFAIAFGMVLEADEKDVKKVTEIQKNLFFDYYADNLLNELRAEEQHIKTSAVDGYGINFKNFAEIAFLWCLESKKCAYDKLKEAYDIIDFCKDKKNGKSCKDFENCTKGTKSNSALSRQYKNDFFAADLQTADDVKDFLINDYPSISNRTATGINIESRTAAKVLEEAKERIDVLIKYINNEFLKDLSYSFEDFMTYLLRQERDCARFFIFRNYMRENHCKKCSRRRGGAFPNCGAFFDACTETDEAGNTVRTFSCRDYYTDDFKNRDDLREALKYSLKDFVYFGKNIADAFEKSNSLFSRLCNSQQAELKRVFRTIEERVSFAHLDDLDCCEVSRSSLIVLCYYEMVLINWVKRINNQMETEGDEEECEEKYKDIIISFKDYYSDFCQGCQETLHIMNMDADEDNEHTQTYKFPGANSLLEAAGYQQINCKNIFDIYVIFLAFRDNYKSLFSIPEADPFIHYAKSNMKKLRLMRKEIEMRSAEEPSSR